MVSVPLRVAPLLASKLYWTTALSEPLTLPVATCRKDALLVAVQVPVVVSPTTSAPADGPSSTEVVPSVAGARRSSSVSRDGRHRAGALRAVRAAERGWCRRVPMGFAFMFLSQLVNENDMVDLQLGPLCQHSED